MNLTVKINNLCGGGRNSKQSKKDNFGKIRNLHHRKKINFPDI